MKAVQKASLAIADVREQTSIKQRAPGNGSGDCRRISVVYLHPPRNKHPWPRALVRRHKED
jgi:hypothetical protein